MSVSPRPIVWARIEYYLLTHGALSMTPTETGVAISGIFQAAKDFEVLGWSHGKRLASIFAIRDLLHDILHWPAQQAPPYDNQHPRSDAHGSPGRRRL